MMNSDLQLHKVFAIAAATSLEKLSGAGVLVRWKQDKKAALPMSKSLQKPE